jgi:IS5 family transposase
MPSDVESGKGTDAMSQLSFSDAEYAGKRKKTRREVFLEEMEQVVPWAALLKVLEPFCVRT